MDRRIFVSLGVGALSVACAAGAFEPGSGPAQIVVEPLADGEGRSLVQGVIRDADTGRARKGALVLLQCACIEGLREFASDLDGVYRFRDLPPGKYTIQVLSGQSNVSRSFDVGPGVQVRADFRIPRENLYSIG